MQPFKIITLIGFLFFSFFAISQEYQFNGKVSIINSRVDNGPIKYVKDVKISNELSPTRITDYKGRFELNFMDVEPNSMVNLKVEKKGYEVVNKDDLNNILISNNPSIRIFLAEEGMLEKMEKRLFKFSLREIGKRKDSIFHLLNLIAVSEDYILEELENNFGQKISDEMEAKLLLNQSIKDLEQELPELIHDLVVINLDFASDQYKKAFELFTQNQLEKALEALDEKELDTSFDNILTSIKQAKETPESYEKIISIRQVQIENVIESYELKSTLLKFAFKFSAAEDLESKIAEMKSTLIYDQSPIVRNDQPELEDNEEVNQTVNILLEDTMQLALIDTNWVEIEMENEVSAKGEEEVEMTGEPKANTILETLPNDSGAKILGADFENTLFLLRDAKRKEIPIYEQPTPILVAAEKVINTSPSDPAVVESEIEWLEFSEVSQLDDSANTSSKKENEKVANDLGKNVFSELIESNYQSYAITKKTSLRQGPTASSKVLKRLKVGAEVQVIDQVDRYWSKAIFNGEVGYVKVLLLEKIN